MSPPNALTSSQAGLRLSPGFSLVELLVVLAIAAVILAVSLPGTQRIYESMQQRELVRTVARTLSAARHAALADGVSQDVVFDNRQRALQYRDRNLPFPDDMRVAFSSAAQLREGDRAVIRFYPEGGASGGDIEVSLPGGSGYLITVDWLLGDVAVKPYVFE